MKRITGLVLIFYYNILIPNTPVQAQLSSSKIDTLVQNSVKKFNVAGVAIAIVKDGKVFYEKGYGVKSITTNSPVDVHTNFQIASNSKAFTTAALSILVDEGKIKWKDKGRDNLPEFKMYNEYVTEQMDDHTTEQRKVRW